MRFNTIGIVLCNDEEDEEESEGEGAKGKRTARVPKEGTRAKGKRASPKKCSKASAPVKGKDVHIDVKYKAGETYKVCDEPSREQTRIRCSDGTSFSIPYSRYGTREKTIMRAREWASFARPSAVGMMKRPAKK